MVYTYIHIVSFEYDVWEWQQVEWLFWKEVATLFCSVALGADQERRRGATSSLSRHSLARTSSLYDKSNYLILVDNVWEKNWPWIASREPHRWPFAYLTMIWLLNGKELNGQLGYPSSVLPYPDLLPVRWYFWKETFQQNDCTYPITDIWSPHILICRI